MKSFPGNPIGVLLAWLVMLLPLSGRASEAKPLPNIVYILTDDLGYGDVSALNPDSKIPTPNIDRLAASGMVFTDAHSGSAVCTPTRYGIMTGRYAWRTHLRRGVLWGFSPPLIQKDRLTVASLLKQSGYRTGMIGKWHLGMDWPLLEMPDDGNWATFHDPKVDWSRAIRNGPTAHGFDSFFGISASLDMPPYVFIENDRTAGIPTVKKSLFKKRTGASVPDFEADHVLQTFGQRACDFIGKSANIGRPFFLYLSLNSPHTPIAPRKEFQGRSGINAYADFVMETDAVVGDLLNAIDLAGIRDDTLIVFTSDNGCSPQADFKALAAAGHNPIHVFRGAKTDLFEGGHRVPFIVSWPAQVKTGSNCSHPVCLTDFLATAAELTGQKLPPNAGEDSFSILPDILGRSSRQGQRYLVHQSVNGHLSIRQGKWKLLVSSGSGGKSEPTDENATAKGLPAVQLYDVEADVGETRNVQSEHPEIVADLTAALQDMIQRGRSTAGPEQRNDVPVPLMPASSKSEE